MFCLFGFQEKVCSNDNLVDSLPESDVSSSITNEAPSTQNQQQGEKKPSDYKFRKIDFVPPNTEWLGSIPPPPDEDMTPRRCSITRHF